MVVRPWTKWNQKFVKNIGRLSLWILWNVELNLTSSVGKFGNLCYRNKVGVVTGGSLSVALANIAVFYALRCALRDGYTTLAYTGFLCCLSTWAHKTYQISQYYGSISFEAYRVFECAHFIHLSGRVQCPVKRDFNHYFICFQLVNGNTWHQKYTPWRC